MDLLTQLHINALNSGAFSGQGWQSNCASSKKRLISYNPTTACALAEIALCSEEDYEHLMQRAQIAAAAWKKWPAPQRGELIRQIAQRLRENKTLLGRLVSLEMGKSIQEGEGEVQEMIDMADLAVGQSRMLYGLSMHSERPCHRMFEQWHPYGVIGVISAFNFPVAVWAWNAFLAAICGNVTLWKPSAKTPLCALAVHHLCASVLIDNEAPEIFALMLPESSQLLDLMVSDSRLPVISFTGSTAVGRQVASRVGGRLGKAILELGGNNAIILDESADLNLAIRSIVFGAVGTTGQRCTSTRRLLIEQSRFDEALSRLKQAYAQIKIGDPLDPQYHMGPLIDKEAVSLFKRTITRIKKAGGHIAVGGEVINSPGFFVQPTLVTGLKNESELIQEETFVPILYLIPYANFEEAIRLHNAVPQGLSSALFTQKLKHAEYFLSAWGSDCGIANINIGTSGAEIGGAFGGEKETGGGREAGSDAWKAYMRRQTNTVNWGDELPLAQGIRFNT